MKKLTKSKKNRVLFGVCGGLGEYFERDPVLFRILFVLLLFVSGIFSLLIAYFIIALILPESNKEKEEGANRSKKRSAVFWLLMVTVLFIFIVSLALFVIFILYGFLGKSGIDVVKEVRQDVVFEEHRLDREKTMKYLEEFIIPPKFGGEIFASYHQIGTEGDRVFVWAYVSEYYREDGEIKQGFAKSFPAALTIRGKEVIEHQRPRTGYYKEDIVAIFPERFKDHILQFQVNNKEVIERMKESTRSRASNF